MSITASLPDTRPLHVVPASTASKTSKWVPRFVKLILLSLGLAWFGFLGWLSVSFLEMLFPSLNLGTAAYILACVLGLIAIIGIRGSRLIA